MAKFITNNNREVLFVKDTITGNIMSLQGNAADGSLNVTAAFAANSSVNVNQIGGSAVLTGNGITGTGSQRVTIASDNTAFSVNATLSAETTKVIGVTRTADGAGNLLTSTSQALDINIKSGSIANTAFIANAGTNLNTSALALESGGNLATIAGAVIAQEATTSGVKGVTAFGAVTTGKPTYTTGKSDALSMDVNGLLRVSLADTPANTNKFLVTPDSVALPANQSVNVSQINGVTPLMGSGIMGTGSPRVTIASDNDALTVKQSVAANLLATVSIAAAQTLSTVTTVSTVSNLSQIASVTPTFGDVTNAAAITGGLNVIAVGVYNTTPASITAGRYNQLQLDVKGNLRGVIQDAAGNIRGANVTASNELLVNVNNTVTANATLTAETTKVIGVTRTADGSGNLLTSSSNALDVNLKTSSITLTISGAVTEATLDAALIAQEATTSSIKGLTAFGAVTTAAPSYTTAKSDALSLTTAGGLRTDIATIAGTAPTTVGKLDVKGADGDVFVRQATATNLKAQVVAGDATGSAVPANAYYQAGVGKTALPAAGSDGNLTGIMTDKFGRQVVLPVTIRDLVATQTTTISASTAETTVVTAGAAGVFNDLMMLVISNTSAATTTRIDFRDTTAGTILFSLFSPAADTRGFSMGGVAIPQTGAATNWTAQCGTSTTDIRVYAVFAKNK